ncbi:E3 ubiquitin-protein ligase RING1-like [Ricinus communis]|uniref:RING-type E3 ubiquitin transferase n=1 Tax=Ricinus communis TaxID=3988 RepID=B9REM4_RICCO|nr:E3 ubiquitin-protein ligase RING1-like [Ricinus communis]EEF50227.1 zinc finger protein, putative [Ricinus communis]|eukprot:XP_002512193.1 E3 ubiquitin-protein ligase RING1-like [Ricinus communis]
MASFARQQQQTYWCHECDMSIHLLITTTTESPLCPHCDSRRLELMDGDDPTPISNDTTSFFLDSLFFPFLTDMNSSSSNDDLNHNIDSILPTVKITASLLEGEEVVCAVCKDEFVIDVDVKILPCNHFFHPDCILPWLNSDHNSCPLCRFHLLPTSTAAAAIHNDDDDDAVVDCAFPDVGALSNFLPSHF